MPDKIPFGVINVSDGTRITGIEEKPSQDFFVNAGIYLLDPDVPELIPDDTYMDMTDLVKILVEGGQRVETFPIHKLLDRHRKSRRLRTRQQGTDRGGKHSAMNGFWKNRKVLVTGADGFIRSHLTQRLLELGASVRAMTKLQLVQLVGLDRHVPALNRRPRSK